MSDFACNVVGDFHVLHMLLQKDKSRDVEFGVS